jgi:hypothetical protein
MTNNPRRRNYRPDFEKKKREREKLAKRLQDRGSASTESKPGGNATVTKDTGADEEADDE